MKLIDFPAFFANCRVLVASVNPALRNRSLLTREPYQLSHVDQLPILHVWQVTVRIVTCHIMASLFFLLPAIFGNKLSVFTCNFSIKKKILPEFFFSAGIGNINKIKIILPLKKKFENCKWKVLREYRVSQKKKKNASGNSAISIADKKRWSDFSAPTWTTLQYVVFTQQQTRQAMLFHYWTLFSPQ